MYAMYPKAVLLSFAAQGAIAFPWVVNQPGVDSTLLKRQQPPSGGGSAQNCPFNANHPGAAPITDEYPYNGARNGAPGKGQGGILVPDPNDAAHQFTAPDYSVDIRGPCPGRIIPLLKNPVIHTCRLLLASCVTTPIRVLN